MYTSLARALCILCGLILLSAASQAFTVSVDAHNEECFFENVEGGTKFGKYYG